MALSSPGCFSSFILRWNNFSAFDLINRTKRIVSALKEQVKGFFGKVGYMRLISKYSATDS